MIWIIVAFIMGIIAGWFIKFPFILSYIRNEINENKKILEKINNFRRKQQKTIVK